MLSLISVDCAPRLPRELVCWSLTNYDRTEGQGMIVVKRAWIPLVVMVLVAIAGFAVYRLHGVFGVHGVTSAVGALPMTSSPSTPST